METEVTISCHNYVRREDKRQNGAHTKKYFCKSVTTFRRNKLNLQVPTIENRKQKSKQNLMSA